MDDGHVELRLNGIQGTADGVGVYLGGDVEFVEPESGAFREPEGYRDAGMTMVASDFCGFGIT
jgi:hypothetical protein